MLFFLLLFFFFFFNDTATTEIYTLSLHDALPIYQVSRPVRIMLKCSRAYCAAAFVQSRSEEHTSELQSLRHLVCRLLLEKKQSMGILPFRRLQIFHNRFLILYRELPRVESTDSRT